MAKSKARSSRKPAKAPEAPPESRAARKKANDARVKQLAKTSRLHAAVAKQSAAIAGLSLQDIPDAVKRDMDSRRRAVTNAKHPPLKRLTAADPKATDPLLINPLGSGK
jgi:hypothetical protein